MGQPAPCPAAAPPCMDLGSAAPGARERSSEARAQRRARREDGRLKGRRGYVDGDRMRLGVRTGRVRVTSRGTIGTRGPFRVNSRGGFGASSGPFSVYGGGSQRTRDRGAAAGDDDFSPWAALLALVLVVPLVAVVFYAVLGLVAALIFVAFWVFVLLRPLLTASIHRRSRPATARRDTPVATPTLRPTRVLRSCPACGYETTEIGRRCRKCAMEF